MDGNTSRVMPQAIKAEQCVLGSIVIDQDVFEGICEIVTSEEFYREDHKEIYCAIEESLKSKYVIDIITVSDALKSRGTLEKVGGLEYLTNLTSMVPTTANSKHYAKIVHEKYILRSLIKASSKIIDACYDEVSEIDDIVSKAELNIFSISNNKASKNIVKLEDCILPCITDLENRTQQKGKITGIPTGFRDFDYKTAGLQNSDLILIAGRPAMGKTSAALNIAEYVGINKNIPVVIFSLEMSKEQLTNRILSSQTVIDSHKLKIGDINDDEMIKISRAIGPMADAPIYIDDTSSIRVSEMYAKCRKLKKEKGLGLVIIDYIQLMNGMSKKENRQQEVSEISRALKIMAKELNLPVIALSQLSRGPESRTDHRPVLSDLRESGAIEQDADIVIFLYRDDYYNPDTDKKNISEMIIAKHRNGGTGIVELVWLPQFTKLANMEKYLRQ